MNILHLHDPHIDEVFILQRLLNKIGYSLTPDGNFGSQTLLKVRQFQKDRRLQIDGVVGPRAWDALFSHPKIASLKVDGLDLSHFETGDIIDWKAMAADPASFFSFCFIKATQGASGSANDPSAPAFWIQLKDAHMIRGVYHFLTYKQDADPVLQAYNFVNYSRSCGVVFKDPGVLPPVVDVEPEKAGTDGEDYMRQHRDVVLSYLKTWLDIVEIETGVAPIIYTSHKNWDDILGGPNGFQRYPLWVANYKDPSGQPLMPSGWNAYTFWQYSESGKIPGNNQAAFDLNRFNGGFRSLARLAGYDGLPTPATTRLQNLDALLTREISEIG